MDFVEPDPRGFLNSYGGVMYGSPLSFEGEALEDYRSIASIPWLKRTAIDEDA